MSDFIWYTIIPNFDPWHYRANIDPSKKQKPYIIVKSNGKYSLDTQVT